MSEQMSGWIVPDWPAPAPVRGGTTTRQGGVSAAPYDFFNMGDHVGDDTKAVAANRELLKQYLGLPGEPRWLKQVHGVEVVDAVSATGIPEADASFCRQSGVVCAVMTADCLPLLLCDQAGTVVAVAHAGWRGLVNGVIEATVSKMKVAPDSLLAWLGPAIGPAAFEVGDEVRAQFVAVDPQAAKVFRPSPQGRWLADLYQLARLRLGNLGVEQIHGGHWCTFTDKEQFYSYRRDGRTGRMASLIWLDSGQ